MIDVALLMRIGSRLIAHHREIARLWPQIYSVIVEAMRLAPEVRRLMELIAPELLR
jgi:hypothetical protein